MTVETLIKMKKLGITKEFMKAIVVNKLPKTGEMGYIYACNNYIWVYCKAPDEPMKRWHYLSPICDFDDSEPLDERERDTK